MKKLSDFTRMELQHLIANYESFSFQALGSELVLDERMRDTIENHPFDLPFRVSSFYLEQPQKILATEVISKEKLSNSDFIRIAADIKNGEVWYKCVDIKNDKWEVRVEFPRTITLKGKQKTTIINSGLEVIMKELIIFSPTGKRYFDCAIELFNADVTPKDASMISFSADSNSTPNFLTAHERKHIIMRYDSCKVATEDIGDDEIVRVIYELV